MADKLMYIPDDDTPKKYPYCRLHLVFKTFKTQLNELTNQNSKVPKVSKPTNKKTLL